MPELVNDGDRRLILQGKFRLAFEWSSDRWEHRLEAESLDQPFHRLLARSVEGDPGRDDPTRVVSPAYQQLQFQNEGVKLQALLVGQSGPHHFSAVFTVEAEGSHVTIEVDIADRCRGDLQALASTYTVDARSDELVDANPSFALWQFVPGKLTFEAPEPGRVSLAEAGRRATQIQALAGSGTSGSTRRLVYRWRWQPDLRSAH